jgi:hypothetical protein
MPHRTEYAPACDQPGADPDLWFREDQESTSIAKRLCGACDLQPACLKWAMSLPDEDQWGIYGGIDAAGRRALRANDPNAWPVHAARLEDYLGTRADRFGSDRYTPYEYREMERPPVDWAATSLDSNVESLMERYGDRYDLVTEPGYALTAEGATVYPLNDVEIAA